MRKILSIAAFLAVWGLLSLRTPLLPSPAETIRRLPELLASSSADIAVTLFRGLLGLLLAAVLAAAAGILCGMNDRLMAFLSPLVTLCQGCPPIVWLSLLMVWAGTGGTVPVLVVVASTFPALFFAVSKGTASLDRRNLEMARLYKVPRTVMLRRLVLPGIAPTVRGALTFAVGITWKVTSTAEFFGSENGIGARIQQAFQRIDMPALFAWTLMLACMGLAVDCIQSRMSRQEKTR